MYPFPNGDSNNLSTKPAKWFKWEDVNGRTIKKEKSGTVFELYTYTKTVANAFLPHCFIKRKQAEQYELDKVQAQKENSNGMVFQMDDAENYTHSAVGEGRTFRRAKIQF